MELLNTCSRVRCCPVFSLRSASNAEGDLFEILCCLNLWRHLGIVQVAKDLVAFSYI